MTRDQFHARLTALDLTVTEFAALVQCAPKTVQDWGTRYGVPYYARLILVLLEERRGAHGLLGRPACTGRLAPGEHATLTHIKLSYAGISKTTPGIPPTVTSRAG